MQKDSKGFFSVNGKRQILIADDEFINREILGNLFEDKYDLIFAEDGKQAINKIEENKDTLSLVLLDIVMPVMDGFEVLKFIRTSPELAHIPVIVATSDRESEARSLHMGASDFISKPYPDAEIVLARVRKTIELNEDRRIISATERDRLTGLYNIHYFNRYAVQLDHFHKDTEMDAALIDIYHFHMINERFGAAYGNEVLKTVAACLKAIVTEKGGMVCRSGADTFLMYLPHQDDYKSILKTAEDSLSGEVFRDNKIRLRIGIYENVDRNLDVAARFDRARTAANKLRGSFSNNIGFYDVSLYEKELFEEQLIDDFPTALKDNQFKVFFQPKYNIKGENPVLSSAEALVRWSHPKYGMVSPGVFIPLFESNGLIEQLDKYVWNQTAHLIAEWEKKYGVIVPVSVNISRIDFYNPSLVDELVAICNSNGLKAKDLFLEITESAYSEDSKSIIETLDRLREYGFRIEMDDFGSGYSSLNMISSLPIDVLKLDMAFIRSAFKDKKDLRLLEIMIDIAKYLHVPTVAEGVETGEQYLALKAIGCDIIQGYYFSKPLPAEEFEEHIKRYLNNL
ncbi:MAG: EAL domain-containing protein [Clostridia bacterium]|nr:EAL domain-containing protein [Clostridia bacterium]